MSVNHTLLAGPDKKRNRVFSLVKKREARRMCLNGGVCGGFFPRIPNGWIFSLTKKGMVDKFGAC
jgi:hypothetical protein